MKASELLRKSADLIRKDGWLQGEHGNPERGFCADGAMGYAGDEQHTLQVARRYFMKAIGIEPRLSIPQQVVRWNDEKGRTKRQVLRNFKKAAKRAEKEGK